LQGDNISTFRLRAYSSNIGESELLRRSYPWYEKLLLC
jgi:hypothetical protein